VFAEHTTPAWKGHHMTETATPPDRTTAKADTVISYAQEMRDELIACRTVLRDASRVLHHIPISEHAEIILTIRKIDQRLASLTYTIGAP
jgi:hypothetical protein